MIVKYFYIVIINLLIVMPVQGGEVVTFSSGEWPPFLSSSYKKYGAGSHIVTEAFKTQGIKVEYGFYPWKRSMEMAKKGEVDATLLWSKNKERESYFYYSIPVMTLSHVFFHRVDMDFEWDTIQNLKGYKIGITRGYYYGEMIDKGIKNGLLHTEIANSDLINFKKLIAGRIQLFIIEPEVGYEILNEHFTKPVKSLVTNNHRPIQARKWYVLISKKSPRALYWLENFNKGLSSIEQSGLIEKIMDNVLLGKYHPNYKD
ncbi:transporter substrate-binding domain-containing protein [Zooshikella marina]|uniref:substrate-binding periplasmic protein n=1 Tax=Zooshikella ganghwensis TaxID=202772 RepID=UPI001BB05156|nr:transporter substrate-binding domain-containing protein [Zooshikella ganghwensis]MBU2705411.1 transporter substrate-binding domain-containing protein [Zooshikella ganghwensis]